ncbi:MAG: hypothetical protein STSR0009_00740 [Methanoregula sp.]
METDPVPHPVAKVTGLYRSTVAGRILLTLYTPLCEEEVRRNPICYELDLNPKKADENRVIDLIYDNLSPLRLPDMRRGMDVPRGVRFWQDWFDIPSCDEMHDCNSRVVYLRAPGMHTVQIRTGSRTFAQMGRTRDFSPENGGYTSPVFEIRIADETYG